MEKQTEADTYYNAAVRNHIAIDANPGSSDAYLSAAKGYKSAITKGAEAYKPVYSLKDKINDDVVYIYRFEPDGSKTISLHRPHITVIVDGNKRLKGFSWVSDNMTGKNTLNEDQCIRLASDFLKRYAPDLKNIKFQWVNDQKFTLIGNDKGRNDINGKWVKFRESNTGEYLWVILATDGRVIEFDRDIVWSFFRGGRVNELWLRDEWLGKRLSKK